MRTSRSSAMATATAALLALAVPAAWSIGTVKPVIEGLNGPRGLGVSPRGQVVYSEANGTVSRLQTKGTNAGTTRHIASVPPGFLAPAVDARAHRVFILTTAGEPNSGAATLYRWSKEKGTRPLADIAAYQEHDVDPYDQEDFPEDSNPYGVASLPRGGALVADAGGNDLLRVRPNGDISTVARIKPRVVRVPKALPDEFEGQPLPPAGTPIRAEGVATSVVVGADGYYYLGELRGFPATPGTSQVWRINPHAVNAVCNSKRPHHGACQRYADGFTSIVDLGAGTDGSIYVAELVKRSWLQWELGVAEPVGGVFRIPQGGGAPTELANNQLILPGAVELGRNDKLFVTGPIFGEGALALIRQ